MIQRDALAIEIGPQRFRAIVGVREGGRLRVKRVLVEELPSDLDRTDPAVLGAWIGARLATARFPTGRATVAVPREHVALKRLTLPTRDPNELPEMTRLALQRDMPFDARQAVIDFVTVARNDTHTTVLAVAVPEPVLERTRAVVAAAGLGVERIGLRAMGSAALLGHLEPYRRECALVVDVTAVGVEFCVVEQGTIRFARAAGLAPGRAPGGEPSAPRTTAEAIITETRRTWMSYRIAEGATDVSRVALMGDPDVTVAAAAPIGEMLGAEAAVIDRHPLVSAGAEPIDLVWPLAGMLLEPTLGRETIDFARPRRPVDLAARRRRVALMAAALAVLVLLVLWTMGRRELSSLRGELDRAETRLRELRPRAERYQRDTFTVAHVRRWASVDVRWLDHVAALRGLMPPRSDAVLDRWTGTLDFDGVRYDRREKTWSTPLQLVIDVEGEARDRATADAMRAALVRTAAYRTTSTGTDAKGGKRLPYGFTYRLTAGAAAAPGAEEASGPDGPGTGRGEGDG